MFILTSLQKEDLNHIIFPFSIFMPIHFNITIISSFFIFIEIVIIIIIIIIIRFNLFGLLISKLFFKTTILEGFNIHFTTVMEIFLIWW